MLISIVTVVYNNPHTIANAIESVLVQDYPFLEYLIIDGASSDNTLEVIEPYKERITKIVSEPDAGIYDAMNKGIALATGDIIGLLNSDDFYDYSSVLSDIARIFEQYPEVEVVYGDLVYVHPEHTDKIVRLWKTKPYYSSFFEDGEVPPHPSLFVRKRVYEQFGGYNTLFKFAADYEFMLRILKRHRLPSYHLDKVLVRMRLAGTTNKNLSNIVRGNREIYQAWKINRLAAPVRLWLIRPFKKLIQYF